MRGSLGPRDKLKLIIGGKVCEVYRDEFSCGSIPFWGAFICFAAFGLFLAYYHMNRDRIQQSN
ncbi:uncharacterized protein Dana_GF15109 [Drosophila ananassae]|uniref:Uncharacterized protein n=1 Tax=Drosophila ananassae TaxID=7217 RepID=B3MMJ2_DROAN|nr:uncharacterized protein LOC6497922 [Drosophila ananassae]EDV30938.1 uncharacterized protein Dana_GF15109 [Drosophila ananassae]